MAPIMSAIRDSAVACTLSFRKVKASHEKTDNENFHQQLDKNALEDEHGRFKVFCGNLGVLQKGHSSLDYRLRDSPLLHQNVLKLLTELNSGLEEIDAVLSGVRLPYDQQTNADDVDSDSASDTSSLTASTVDEGDQTSELGFRFLEMVDIIDNLYRLSIRIRTPTLDSRATKAASFRQVDKDTNIDLMPQFALFDEQHTIETLRALRGKRQDMFVGDVGDDPLVARLSRAITRRRQQFKYWRKHRAKLAALAAQEPPTAAVNDREDFHPRAEHTTPPEIPSSNARTIKPNEPPLSEFRPKTLLSGTEATTHHKSLDDELVETQTVTSIATTAKDLEGHRIDLPPPPSFIIEGRDFECPYCFVICPSKYARDRGWRNHLLQDLQPYICTYRDCSSAGNLFRSRRDWLEHERSVHRKIWRCPAHPSVLYRSEQLLEAHFRQDHTEKLSSEQLGSLLRASETSTEDERQYCPICLVDSSSLKNMSHHIANHLERLAAFALPKDADTAEDVSGGSNDAHQGLDSESSDATEQALSTSGESEAFEDDMESEISRIAESVHPTLWQSSTTPQGGHHSATKSKIESVIDELRDRVLEIDQRLLRVARKLLHEVVSLRPDQDHELRIIDAKLKAVVRKLQESRIESVHSLIKEIVTLCGKKFDPDSSETSRYTERLLSLEKELDRWEVNTPFENSSAVARMALTELSSVKRVLMDDDLTTTSLRDMSIAMERFVAAIQRAYDHTDMESQTGSLVMVRKQLLEETSHLTLNASSLDAIPDGRDQKMNLLSEFEAVSVETPDDTTTTTTTSPPDEQDIGAVLRTMFDLRILLENQANPGGWQQGFQVENRANMVTSLTQEYRDAYGKQGSLAEAFRTSLDYETECFKHAKTEEEYMRKTVDRLVYLQEVQNYDWIFNRMRREATGAHMDFVKRVKDTSLPQRVTSDAVPTVWWYNACLLFPPAPPSTDDQTPFVDPRNIGLVSCDILALEVDVIVNAVGRSLEPGTGSFLNSWLHQFGGDDFASECAAIGEMQTGDVAMTSGGNLRCKHVIHACRPAYSYGRMGQRVTELRDCYRKSLELAIQVGARSIAFPSLSTGGFGFPKQQAAEIAVREVREVLGRLQQQPLVVFCAVQPDDFALYKRILPMDFPGRIWSPSEIHQSIDPSHTQASPLIRKNLFKQASVLGKAHKEVQMSSLLYVAISTFKYGRMIGGNCFSTIARFEAPWPKSSLDPVLRWQEYWYAFSLSMLEPPDNDWHFEGPRFDASVDEMLVVEVWLATILWDVVTAKPFETLQRHWRSFEPAAKCFMYGSDHLEELSMSPWILIQTLHKHLMKTFHSELGGESIRNTITESSAGRVLSTWGLVALQLALGDYEKSANLMNSTLFSWEGLSQEQRETVDRYWGLGALLWLTNLFLKKSAEHSVLSKLEVNFQETQEGSPKGKAIATGGPD